MLEISADGGKIQTMKQKNNYILNLYLFLGKLIKSECLNIFRSCDINNEMLTAGLLGPPGLVGLRHSLPMKSILFLIETI